MTSFRVLEDAISGSVMTESYDVVSGEVFGRQLFGELGRGPIPLSVSVLIRTLNEERLLPYTLAAIGEQIGGKSSGASVQLLVVDSGSTDRTLDIAQAFGCDLVQLPPGSFTYGYALNVGVACAAGEIVVPLSAHAVPTSGLWLANLVMPFVVDRGLAGVFGQHVPWPDATDTDRLMNTLYVASSPQPRYIDAGWPVFSNTNAAIRRRLLLEVPFDEQVGNSCRTRSAPSAPKRST